MRKSVRIRDVVASLAGIAETLFISVCLAAGCDSAGPSQYDLLNAEICPKLISASARAYLIDSSSVAIVCNAVIGTKTSPAGQAVYRLDENSAGIGEARALSHIYATSDDRFVVKAIIDDTLYISPQPPRPGSPALQALRLDAGQVTPATVVQATMHPINEILVSGAYVYWTWDDPVGVSAHGLSRAPLLGGAEELVAPLPFSPIQLVIAADRIYAFGYSNAYDVDRLGLIDISMSNRAIETLLSEAPSERLTGPLLAAYQDHVLFSDTSAVPPKIYKIDGEDLQRDTMLKCAPDDTSVLSGSIVSSFNVAKCASSEVTLTVTDLRTNAYGEYRAGLTDLPVGDLAGFRGGWVYWTAGGGLARAQVELH